MNPVNSASWCQHPFHSLMVTPRREVRPCCRYLVPDSEREWSQSVNRAVDIFENGYFQKLREQMNNGHWAAGCGNCRREEALGLESMRQNSARNSPDDQSQEVTLSQIELAVGRLCNLRCRTCGPHSSTKWDGDAKHLGQAMEIPANELDLNNLPVEAFTKVRKLKITGGEPLLHMQFLNLLSRLIRAGLSQNIELELFTNCTMMPKADLLCDLSRFARVDIWLSLDDIGPRSDYIRSGSDWAEVSAVAQRWQEWIRFRSNNRLVLAVTISTLNIYSISDLIKWAHKELPAARFFFQPVHDPGHLSVFGLSESVRARLIEKLRGELRDSAEAKLFGKLESILRAGDGRPAPLSHFFSQTAKLDALRGESFAAVFPELNQFLMAENSKENLQAQEPAGPDLALA